MKITIDTDAPDEASDLLASIARQLADEIDEAATDTILEAEHLSDEAMLARGGRYRTGAETLREWAHDWCEVTA